MKNWKLEVYAAHISLHEWYIDVHAKLWQRQNMEDWLCYIGLYQSTKYIHTVSLEHSMLWYGTTSVLPTIHVFIAEIICYPSVTVLRCWQHCMICTMVVIVKKRTLTRTLVVCHWDDFPLSIFHLVTTVKLFLNARKVQNFVWKWKNDLRVFLLTNNQYCLGLPI